MFKPMLSRRTFLAGAAALGAVAVLPIKGNAAQPKTLSNFKGKTMIQNIVLVHGAFADGSCYAEVIRHLQAAGLNAVAVQNPLTSLAADAQSIQRTLGRLSGKTLLVGHSWGGVPVSHAGGHENVAALLYLSAIVPGSGESAADALNRQNAPMEGLTPDKHGEIILPPEAFAQVMANGLPAEQSRLLAAVQTPMTASAFADKIGTAAWHNKPSYYLLTENDNALPFAVQQRFATQIGAKTRQIQSGHLSMLAEPQAVAEWIKEIVAEVGE